MNQNKLLSYLLGSCLFGLLLVMSVTACTDTTNVGADFLDEDQLTIGSTDTFTVRTYTTLGEPVRTFSPLSSRRLSNYMIGNLEDPVFGETMSNISLSFTTNASNPVPEFAESDNFSFDSLVLVLKYDVEDAANEVTANHYGAISETFSFEVYELTELIDRNEEYYSDTAFAVSNTSVGTHTFWANPYDSLTIQTPAQETGTESKKVGASVRIPLHDDFGMHIFTADTTEFLDDEAFHDFLHGLHIVSADTDRGMLAFQVENTTSGLFLYYSDGDKKGVYHFQITPVTLKHQYVKHDYTGSTVAASLDANDDNQNTFFVQGLAGVNGVLDFPHLENLAKDNRFVNKAVLEIHTKILAEDEEDIFAAASELTLQEMTDEGDLIDIEDVSIDNGSSFGGEIADSADGMSKVYRMNVTAQVQKILAGDATTKMLLSVADSKNNPARSVLSGGNSVENPVTLRLTFSEF